MVEKLFLLKYLEKTKILSHLYVLFLVVISFVIFNATSLFELGRDFQGMFGMRGFPIVTAETLYYLRSYAVVFVIAIFGATPISKKIVAKLKAVQILEPIVLLLMMVVVTAYLVDGSFNPFLYFRF